MLQSMAAVGQNQHPPRLMGLRSPPNFGRLLSCVAKFLKRRLALMAPEIQ